MNKVYLDVGFGFTKALSYVDNQERTILRPSVYSEFTPNENETGIESPFGNYLFGQSALDTASMHNRFTTYEDCLSDAYAANVLLAISEMNGANSIDCELVLSLPFDAMYLQKQLKARLTGSYRIRRLGYHWQTISVKFPEKWGIMPQNAAPAFATLDPRRIDRTGLIWIAVCNLGSKTFEMGTFGINLDSYSLRPGTREQQSTKQVGAYTLANAIEPLLLEHFRGKLTSFDQHTIFKIMRDEQVELGNQIIDVSDLIKDKKREYVDTITNHCKNLWSAQNGRELYSVYQFCLSGGGTHIVSDYLHFHNNIQVSDNPQFDVVVGSMKWHKLIGG